MDIQEKEPSITVGERIRSFSKKTGERVLKLLRGPDPQALIRKRMQRNVENGRDPLYGFRRLRSAEASFHPYPVGHAYPAGSISSEGAEGEITPDDRLAVAIPPSG